jgi:hypothetical protein
MGKQAMLKSADSIEGLIWRRLHHLQSVTEMDE